MKPTLGIRAACAFPTLAALVARGALGQPDEGGDDFEFGLERILDGIEGLLEPA